MKIFCLIIILLAGVFKSSFSQNTWGLPQIINYDKDDYNGGSQTWNISQDSTGKMYFANNEGLISFDGNYWKVYSLPNKTIVRSLAIGPGNRIYVGGQGEIGYFSPDIHGVLHYTSLKTIIPEEYKRFADVWKIIAIKNHVFFQTSDRIFEYVNNSMKVFPAKVEWLLLAKAGERLFCQEKSTGLLEFKNNQWQPLRNNKLLRKVVLSGIINISPDSLLLTAKKKGFYLLHRDSISKYDIETINIPSEISMSLKMNESEMVAGTLSDGCLFMDFKGNIIQKISGSEGLQNNNVLCVFLDKDNNLWAGLNNGISFIAYNSAIKYIKPNKSNELSGYSSVIFNQQLYIGTSDGAYAAPLHNQNHDFSFCKSDFRHIPNTSGETWKVDEVNQHLLLGLNGGTFTIKNNISVPVAEGTGSWLFASMPPVIPSKNILVGTYTGLKMLSYNNDHFTDEGSINGLYESFRFIAIDNDNTIWASHPYRGIYKLVLSPDHKNFTYQLYTEKDGLPSTLENYVFKIKDKVVFATSKGIYEYNPDKDSFSPSPFLSNVFHDMDIRYLKEDNDGNIWFCSGKKIGLVDLSSASDKKPFRITYFPELTGQILSGFENIYPYNNENVFISSEQGIIHLNYVKYAATKLQIKVLLGQVRAIGKKDSLIFGGFYFQNATSSFKQDEKEIFHLPASYNSFHFEYSSPNYGLQKNIEYSYRLKGYDSHWSEWSPKSEKDYTNLPEGKYTFFVKAHDNLGHESEVVSYEFYVKPSWYNTVWAYMAYIVLFMLMLYLLYKWQERSLKKQQLKFEMEQKRLEELHQLKLEKREKEIIKLQNEKLANEVKFKNKELADATMTLVERDSALLKVKDELQKLYKKTGNNHDVKKTLLLLKDVEQNSSSWEQFVTHFNEVNNDYLKKLKTSYPSISNNDIKVCTYLKLNLSSKEIAQLMNISVRGVEISRYRLRKKLQIPSGQTLNDFLNQIA
ncbi:MAG TPA: triple tyrosine motif-containing protein [Hanamia sp.]|nr:triple tyrosine motif-containing protein [Hanamia sp.]